MDDAGIKRINELAAIAKQRELTPEEASERAGLRQEYLKDFREGFRKTLENTSVKNPDGSITPLTRAKPEKPSH